MADGSRMLTLALVLCGALLVGCAQVPGPPPRATPCLHAHNDYFHARPLLDALEHGCCSVEADVHLVKGELYVAHDRWMVRRGFTLRRLYLDPLRQRVRRGDVRGIQLLVDVKSRAEPAYERLSAVLEKYRDMLTVFTDDEVRRGPVTVVISGNRPRALARDQGDRLAALDGRLGDLDGGTPASRIPLISDRWSRVSRWRGAGPMPEADRAELRDIVARAHAAGRTVRFWATPDERSVWRELAAAGVDLLSVDDLASAHAFVAVLRGADSGIR